MLYYITIDTDATSTMKEATAVIINITPMA